MKYLIIVICAFVCSFESNGQQAKSWNSHDQYTGRDYDSIMYYSGIQYYNKGSFKRAKNLFRNVFGGDYTKWNDSTVNFLNKQNKLGWISDFSLISIKGYTYDDSLHYAEGKKFYENNDWLECERHFRDKYYYNFRLSIYFDSASVLLDDNRKKLDSLQRVEKIEKEKMERKWVYVGSYYDEDKYGNQSYYAYSTYYDVNHLLYEGDTACVMLKVDNYQPTYRYVSVNLVTGIVHGIDASDYSGESYSYVWDGDWWRNPNSDFSRALYKIVIEKQKIKLK